PTLRPALFPYTTLFRSNFLPPRLTARSTESMVCMNGMGPVDVVLFERIGEPWARSLVTDRPMPPVPLVSHMTSRTQGHRRHRPRSEEHTSELQSQANLV